MTTSIIFSIRLQNFINRNPSYPKEQFIEDNMEDKQSFVIVKEEYLQYLNPFFYKNYGNLLLLRCSKSYLEFKKI